MPEVHDLLERRAADYQPPSDLLARVYHRGQRRQQARRVGTAMAIVLVTAVTAGSLYRALTPTNRVAFDPSTNPWAGTWVSIDTDGSSQTMDISASDGGGYDVVLNDDAATVCSGAPATVTGTGRLDSAGLVLPALELECDDGSTPEAVDGSSLEEALRDYTLVHDPAGDTLSDSFGVEWRRPGATPEAGTSEGPIAGMWPQSTLDEVREAQRKADEGDPAYTWQVEPAIDDIGGDAEIFSRYLTEELGWEGFRWGAESHHAGSMHWAGSDRSSEVDFVRCAAGEQNSLYPDDPHGRRCAPTLDDLRYETVRVTAYQPLDASPQGIWVVQSSVGQPPFRQTVPPSDAEIAAAVEPFLQARVNGGGAGQLVDSDATEIPLLYAASNGARYDRFDHEVLEGPIWPFGTVVLSARLFADGGKSLVEQTFRLEQGFLDYDPHGKQTTENGAPIGEPYNVLDGRVTFSVSTALGSWQDPCCSTPGGKDWAAVQGYLGDYSNQFAVVVDPLPPAGTCGVGDQPVSADELVGSVRSSRRLSVTAKAAHVGGIDAVRLDVTSGDQAATCSQNPMIGHNGAPVLAPRPGDGFSLGWYAVNSGNKARLYVFDLPGNPERTVVIVVLGPRSTFERLLEGAQPILDSFELNTE